MDHPHWMITHNLTGRNPDEIIREFETNDTYRSKRSSVTLYHEILSFAKEEDPQNLDLATLYNVAQAYIQRRNSNALVMAIPHYERENIHIHFMFSGNEFQRAKTLRMDDKEFMAIRRDMERWQLRNLPHLDASIVYLGDRERDRILGKAPTRQEQLKQILGEPEQSPTITDREYHVKKRAKQPSKKERAREAVKEALDAASNLKSFGGLVKSKGFTIYERGGIPYGVVLTAKKNYRFSSMGLSKAQQQKLDRMIELIKREQKPNRGRRKRR